MRLSSSVKFKDLRSLQIKGEVASFELLKECLKHHQCVRKLHILDFYDLFLKLVAPSVVMDRNFQQI